MPILADKEYRSAGIWVHIPFKEANHGIDNRSYNALLPGVRANTTMNGSARRHHPTPPPESVPS